MLWLLVSSPLGAQRDPPVCIQERFGRSRSTPEEFGAVPRPQALRCLRLPCYYPLSRLPAPARNGVPFVPSATDRIGPGCTARLRGFDPPAHRRALPSRGELAGRPHLPIPLANHSAVTPSAVRSAMQTLPGKSASR